MDQNYYLFGIGDFSHGDSEIWKLRIKLVKYLLKNTDKHITIFQEDMADSVRNIYTDKNLKIYTEEKFRQIYPLARYGFKIYSSKLYLRFINLLRKNRDRIIMYGVDTDSSTRDLDMFINIMKNIDYNGYNLFFSHNNHVDSRSPIYMNTKTTGYYLSKTLRDKYKIILSTGLRGKIRYDAVDGEIKERNFIKSFDYRLELDNIKNGGYIEKYRGKIFEVGWSWSINNEFTDVHNVDLIVFDNVTPLK